jgi:hypothetical protein
MDEALDEDDEDVEVVTCLHEFPDGSVQQRGLRMPLDRRTRRWDIMALTLDHMFFTPLGFPAPEELNN